MSDLKSRKDTITACTEDLERRLDETRQKLTELQSQSPRIMAAFFLGESPRETVTEHKARIAELESSISEAETGLQGLDFFAAECRQTMARESKREAARKAQTHYEELKGRISALGDPSTYDRLLESSFRSAAAGAGKMAEASEILLDLQKRRDHRPLSGCQPVNDVVNHG
jgi:chromosome segregation ATPase